MAAREKPVLVYVYWDHSNSFIEAQNIADEIEREKLGDDISRMTVAKAVEAGSVPPEVRDHWKRMERQGIRTEVIDRNNYGGRERDVPDTILQREMLADACINEPATVILLTGDGAGWNVRKGFMNTLQCMKKRGWEVELLSWYQSCNARLRQWVETNGHFTCLDHFYKSITFVEPSDRDKGRKLDAVELWKKQAGPFAPPPPPPGQ